MSRMTENQTHDTLVGQAVLNLIKGSVPVTVQNLVNQLGEMLQQENSEIIRQTIARTIESIQQSLTAARNNTYFQVRNHDKVLVSFSLEGQQNDKNDKSDH